MKTLRHDPFKTGKKLVGTNSNFENTLRLEHRNGGKKCGSRTPVSQNYLEPLWIDQQFNPDYALEIGCND